VALYFLSFGFLSLMHSNISSGFQMNQGFSSLLGKIGCGFKSRAFHLEKPLTSSGARGIVVKTLMERKENE